MPIGINFGVRGSDKSKAATQKLVPIKEVRDGISILEDGTLRATLIVSSLNFALKSQDEQNAIIYAYQDFLNSLDFPVQITIMSRKLDITPYLEELRQRKEKQTNELLRLQMEEYANFIQELVKDSNIMAKTFLATVPFSLQQSKKGGSLDKLKKGLRGAAKKTKQLSDSEFDHFKAQLLQRAEQVAVGLRGVGLRVALLQTQEMLELYYDMLNPNTSRNQPLANVAKMDVKETDLDNITSTRPKNKPWIKR